VAVHVTLCWSLHLNWTAVYVQKNAFNPAPTETDRLLNIPDYQTIPILT